MSRFWLKKIDEAYARGLTDGWNMGFYTGVQFNNDIYQSCLNSAEAMGRDTLGKGRMRKLVGVVEKAHDTFAPALHPITDAEADVWQARLDERMERIWEEETQPFRERYPYLLECEYGGKKK